MIQDGKPSSAAQECSKQPDEAGHNSKDFSGSSSQQQPQSSNGVVMSKFSTKLNKAKDKAKQYIGFSNLPGTDAKHEENTSEGSAEQYIGVDMNIIFRDRQSSQTRSRGRN